MSEIEVRDEQADRISKAVEHALALVGPAEHGAERGLDDRAVDDRAVEDPVS